jgi:hypothetical protein
MSFPDPHNDETDGAHLIAADRRRRMRYPSKPDRLTKVVLLTGPDGNASESVVTCIVDYSTLGMGLIHPAEIRPGEQFYLDTESAPGHLLTRRLLRCSRCTPMDGGRFLIGAEFIK